MKVLGNRASELFRRSGTVAEDKGGPWQPWDERFFVQVLVLGEPSVTRTCVAGLFADLEKEGTARGVECRIFEDLGPHAQPALDVMVSSLASRQHHVRAAAAYGIGLIGRPAESAIPELKARLQDERVIVRLRAAQALGRIGSTGENTVGTLRLLQSDPYASVREAATQAIAAIQAN